MNDNTESLTDFVESIVVVRPTYHIKSEDLNELTEKVYGKRIKINGSDNAEIFKYTVTKFSDEEIKKLVQSGIVYGAVHHMFYSDILNDLCHKGLLDEGEYYIHYEKN